MACPFCRADVEGSFSVHMEDFHEQRLEATPEMRRAVRRDECRTNGHTISGLFVIGQLAPQQVYCTNCGGHWRIHPEDIGEHFGTAARPAVL